MDTASSRPTIPQVRSRTLLSPRGRSLAFVFIVLALITFFIPLMHVDPPVMGKEHWSALDIALAVQANLGAEAPFFFFLVPYASIYLLLLVALVTVCIAPARKALLWITGIALFFLLAPLRGILGAFRLPSMFTSGKGHDPSLWFLLVLLTSVVMFIVWKDTPD